MVDEQRPRTARSRLYVGQRVAACVTVTLLLFVMGGCVGGGSPSGAQPTTATPGGPAAVAPVAPSTAPTPSPPGSPGVGTAPCLSATDPGQLCGGGPALPSPSGSAVLPPAPPTASPPAATPVTPTGPTGAPVPSPGQPAASSPVVTVADDGAILHLVVGQRFLLDLGSTVDWTVTIADQRVVGRVIGVLVIRGAQGIYEARTAGTTLLSAIGSPPCPTGGVCPLFRVGFHLTIAVS
jgi:hypothetical protein